MWVYLTPHLPASWGSWSVFVSPVPSTSADKNHLSQLHQEIKTHLDPHPNSKIKLQEHHPQLFGPFFFFVSFAIFFNPTQHCRQTGEWGKNKLYCPGLEMGIFLFFQILEKVEPSPCSGPSVSPQGDTHPTTGTSAPLGCHRKGFVPNSSSLPNPGAGSDSPSPWIWQWDNFRVRNQHTLVCASLPFNFCYFSVKILKKHNVFYT